MRQPHEAQQRVYVAPGMGGAMPVDGRVKCQGQPNVGQLSEFLTSCPVRVIRESGWSLSTLRASSAELPASLSLRRTASRCGEVRSSVQESDEQDLTLGQEVRPVVANQLLRFGTGDPQPCCSCVGL